MNESVSVSEPAAFVAIIVILKEPAPAGIPEISPVEVLMLRLAGKPVALKKVGLLLAVII